MWDPHYGAQPNPFTVKDFEYMLKVLKKHVIHEGRSVSQEEYDEEYDKAMIFIERLKECLSVEKKGGY